jgi:hypothetical protein
MEKYQTEESRTKIETRKTPLVAGITGARQPGAD